MVHLNSPTIGGEAQVPFGGMKASGVGEREMAKDGMHFFTEQKTVFVDYTGQRDYDVRTKFMRFDVLPGHPRDGGLATLGGRWLQQP